MRVEDLGEAVLKGQPVNMKMLKVNAKRAAEATARSAVGLDQPPAMTTLPSAERD